MYKKLAETFLSTAVTTVIDEVGVKAVYEVVS